MQKENIAVSHPVVALTFTGANFAASQDATAVPATANNNTYAFPWSGHVIGLSVDLNDDVTSGTITLKPTVGGTESTEIAVQLDTENTAQYSGVCGREEIPFAANQQIGVVYDSSADLAPETADGNVVLFVVFDEVDY